MILLYITLVVTAVSEVYATQVHSIPTYGEEFCSGNNAINSRFTPGISGGYVVDIKKNLTVGTEVKVKLDSVGTVFVDNNNPFYKFEAKFTTDNDIINNIFSFVVLKETPQFTFNVKGKNYPNHPPYIVSIKINGEENCRNPDRSYFERFTDVIKLLPAAPDKFCGRRRIDQESLPLIVSGGSTKAGHWPWHVAINKMSKRQPVYICGGTLISKYLVLTAAHCASVRGVALNPEILGVILGKYNLYRTEITSQDKEVFEVIVHDDFDRHSLNNDIALLKLSSEATFNNFVQPACIWFDGIYDNMPSYEITGTVVGWGIDQSDTLSKNLQTASVPIVSDYTCILYEPVFYTNMLNGKNKFCAGNSNGTSACNGDSGGGLMVYVDDDKNSYLPANLRPGAWYVKGIVSATLTRKDADICDPNAYTIYTDVAKYRSWILTYTK